MESDSRLTELSCPVAFLPLGRHHEVESFDCGIESLDLFIRKYALTGPSQGLTQTWVAVAPDDLATVLAYYTLGIASVMASAAPLRVAKGVPAHYGVPCVLLARLAVRSDVQGDGLGSIVLEQAMRKALQLAKPVKPGDRLPMRAMLVHALNEDVVGFYTRRGFEPMPGEPLHLMALFKDIEKSFRSV
jgi:GNAT superfamily N-acetyltransferase